MVSVVNKISSSNENFISFLENPLVKYSILIFVVLLIILIEKIDTKYLDIFDLDIFKVVYALLIAYTACFDPIYAIILTTFMIMAIQEVHSRRSTNALNKHKIQEIENNKIKEMNNNKRKEIEKNKPEDNKEIKSNKIKQTFVPSTIDNDTHTQTSQSVVYESMPDNDILINDKMIYDLINKQSLQKIPNKNDTLVAEYDYYDDPAFKTITNNLKESNTSNKNQFFVSNEDLIKAQTNIQQGVDQNASLKAFAPNILNIQGLPNGYDPKSVPMGYM
jgi:hypothetical protein